MGRSCSEAERPRPSEILGRPAVVAVPLMFVMNAPFHDVVRMIVVPHLLVTAVATVSMVRLMPPRTVIALFVCGFHCGFLLSKWMPWAYQKRASN